MRQWRVGTFSMGTVLILAGAGLLGTAWNGAEAFDFALTWWPVIFILLGVEVLVYLFRSKEEKPVIRYDFFSIFFIGILCFGCLGLSLLTVTGVLGEVRAEVARVDKVIDLPEIRRPVEGVEKIVVHSSNPALGVSRNAEKELYFFGSCQVEVADRGHPATLLEEQDVLTYRQVGKVLYVDVKDLPRRSGLFGGGYWTRSATLVVPDSIPMEIHGAYRT